MSDVGVWTCLCLTYTYVFAVGCRKTRFRIRISTKSTVILTRRMDVFAVGWRKTRFRIRISTKSTVILTRRIHTTIRAFSKLSIFVDTIPCIAPARVWPVLIKQHSRINRLLDTCWEVLINTAMALAPDVWGSEEMSNIMAMSACCLDSFELMSRG